MKQQTIFKRRKIRKLKPELPVGPCVVVRQDMPPCEWWDGYYVAALAPLMADWWTKELGVRCFVMAASYPDLPESAYHTTKQ
jgi:hypothetical protein